MAKKNIQSDEFQKELTKGNEAADGPITGRCPVCHMVIGAISRDSEPGSVTGEPVPYVPTGDSEKDSDAKPATAKCPACHQPRVIVSPCPNCHQVPGGVARDTEASATTARCPVCNSLPGPSTSDAQSFGTEDNFQTLVTKDSAETYTGDYDQTNGRDGEQSGASVGGYRTRHASAPARPAVRETSLTVEPISIESISSDDTDGAKSSPRRRISVIRYQQGEEAPELILAEPGERIGRDPNRSRAEAGFCRTVPTETIMRTKPGMFRAYNNEEHLDRQISRYGQPRVDRTLIPENRISLHHNVAHALYRNRRCLCCCAIVGSATAVVAACIWYFW